MSKNNVKTNKAADYDMKSPQNITGDSNIAEAFKVNGNGGGSYGAFTNGNSNRPA